VKGLPEAAVVSEADVCERLIETGIAARGLENCPHAPSLPPVGAERAAGRSFTPATIQVNLRFKTVINRMVSIGRRRFRVWAPNRQNARL